MISTWWLALIIPIIGAIGICIGGLIAVKGQQDDCADCQYKCKNCSFKKEKSN